MQLQGISHKKSAEKKRSSNSYGPAGSTEKNLFCEFKFAQEKQKQYII